MLWRSMLPGGVGGVKLTASPRTTNGTGVYMLIDVSGSMGDAPRGGSEVKLGIAKRAANAVCKQIAKYAEEDKARNIQLAIASFSDDMRPVVAMGKPDPVAAERAINGLSVRGGTAIGKAVQQAQRELDQTGLRRQHILIVTDGENTAGVSPEKVAAAIKELPEEMRPSVYVVAFDVNADVFAGVKGQGWQVFSAANGKELEQQLDMVVGGHILIEQ